jgi:hypothetical protein
MKGKNVCHFTIQLTTAMGYFVLHGYARKRNAQLVHMMTEVIKLCRKHLLVLGINILDLPTWGLWLG